MAHIILIHLSGEEPIAGEVDELPKPTDTVITVSNHYIDSRAVKVIWPLEKISFIEVLSGEESEQIISFVRE
jgi:hypothetical protein